MNNHYIREINRITTSYPETKIQIYYTINTPVITYHDFFCTEKNVMNLHILSTFIFKSPLTYY